MPCFCHCQYLRFQALVSDFYVLDLAASPVAVLTGLDGVVAAEVSVVQNASFVEVTVAVYVSGAVCVAAAGTMFAVASFFDVALVDVAGTD